MPKMKARKVIVSFEVALHEENREVKLKKLKADAESEAPYLAEAVGGIVKKVVVAAAE